ncbi:MAG: response regulator [Pseudomonadales bacterium]|nr:response regulator [Pseudomonadales bacterium]NRA18268.1 response regulator [Oceanospirillaceae bacterium]
MFDNMKLSTMLGIGFGMVVTIMIITSTLSYIALNDASEGFREYRLLARDTNLAGRLQANMLQVRLNVKDFLKTGSQSSVSNYRSRLLKLEQFLREAEVEIQQAERARNVAIVSDSIHDYARNFDQVIAFKQQRDDLVFNNLDPTGLAMRTKLTAIMTSAFEDQDPEASYYAGRIQEHVLLARLFASKFLNTNADKDANRFELEIGANIDKEIVSLERELDNPTRKTLFAEFKKVRELYRQHFKAVNSLIIKRNEIINQQLDGIGPAISKAAEDVKLSVKADQDILGPKVQASNEEALLIISIFSIIGFFLSIFLSWLITIQIRKPIGGEPLAIMAITQQVALGKTNIDFQSDAEPSGIFAALKDMVAALNIKVKLAQEIARGNLDIQVDLVSNDDTLGIALMQMIEQLKERNLKVEEEGKARAQALKVVEDQSWLKTQVAQVNNVSQGIEDLRQLSKEVIKALATAVNAGQGVFYVLTTEGTDEPYLNLLGTYAFKKRKNVSNRLKLGEGLAGQCALEKETIILTEVPKEYIQISSGLGELAPLNVIVLPVLYEERCLGVIELATFKAFSQLQEDLLAQVALGLGVIINSVLGRQRIEELLVSSKQQSAVLQNQQEELKSANEVLLEQTDKLKASEGNLKQQSEQLKVSNEELSEKQDSLQQQKQEIEQSQAELTIKARDLALASKYKSEFLANMSHELRTPLNSLLLLAKGLGENRKGNLDDSQVEDAQIIHDSGHNLLTIINDILDLSKVEAGKLTMHLEEVHIETLTSNMRKMFTPIATDKGLDFKIEIANTTPKSITTDGQRIEQILRNLLSNALKFTEFGTVTLTIAPVSAEAQLTVSSLTHESTLALSVVDTGIGIPNDKLQEIFEAFQQQDGSTSRRYGGTGLGLTIAKELTRILGGEIQVFSEPGEGSIFTLYLPYQISEGMMDSQNNSLANPALDTKTSHLALEMVKHTKQKNQPAQNFPLFINDQRNNIQASDKSLLIIDDDKDFAKILRDLATAQGFKCLVAGDGRSGIYLAQQYQPQGIILDLKLPDIDGHQVLEQLKFSLKTRHIPVEVISGHTEGKVKVLGQGAIGLLVKPVKEQELLEVLSKITSISSSEVRNILIIEDDTGNRIATTRLLENSKMSITSVATGEAGCSEISSGKYDCVILDLGLPDMTGFEVLKRINTQKTTSIPPIIIYTGKEITEQEQAELSHYSSTIVIKGVGSAERLLDDVSLFMHHLAGQQKQGEKESISLHHDEDLILQNRKILLVDDDMRNSYALSKRLIESGLEVELANNGKEAVKFLEQNNDIELVLMDIMMPVMDGNQAIKLIRQNQVYKSIPIIALTAKTMPEDRQKCFDSGASEYITKPIDFDKLLSIMRIWLFKRV